MAFPIKDMHVEVLVLSACQRGTYISSLIHFVTCSEPVSNTNDARFALVTLSSIILRMLPSLAIINPRYLYELRIDTGGLSLDLRYSQLQRKYRR